MIHADCRDLLPSIAERSIDLVLVDPPYGDTSLSWDDAEWGWLTLLRPLLKPSASLWCFGSLRMFMASAAAFSGWRFAQDVVWEKHNGSIFHADRFRRVHEHIAQFYPVDVAWGDIYKSPVTTPDAVRKQVRRKQRPPHAGHIEAGSYTSLDGGPRLQRSVLKVPSCHGYAVHPTQKPEALLRPLIEYSCPPSGLVLDCFAGSGSTGVAAVSIGRDALLIEKDAAYCALAEKRINGVQVTLPLFDGPACPQCGESAYLHRDYQWNGEKVKCKWCGLGGMEPRFAGIEDIDAHFAGWEEET